MDNKMDIVSKNRTKEQWIRDRTWYLMMMDGDHAIDLHIYRKKAEQEWEEMDDGR